MSVTDAKIDSLLASVNLLIEENRELRQIVQRYTSSVCEIVDEKVLTLNDLSARYGQHRSTISRKPWILPNFGVSDFPEGTKRWKMSTVLAWEEKTPQQHKQEWRALSIAERKKIAGVA